MTAKVIGINKGRYLFKFAGLARSLFVLTEHMTSWRASEASETLSGVYKFELAWYMCIASEASETLSGVYKFELVRYIYISESAVALSI